MARPRSSMKRASLVIGKGGEALDDLHVGRALEGHGQGVARLKRGLAGLHRVDDVALHGLHVIVGEIAFQSSTPPPSAQRGARPG